MWNGVVVGVWFVGTLLGPERAGHPCGGDRLFSFRTGLYLIPRCPRGGCCWWGRVAGVWLYVENCTVDASIF